VYLLTRVVRLPLTAAPYQIGTNGLVGSSAAGFAGIGEFHVACRGDIPESGYLVDISVIDRAIRAILPGHIAVALREEARTGRTFDPVASLRAAADELAERLPAALASLAFRPSPFLEVRLEFGEGQPNSGQTKSGQSSPGASALPSAEKPTMTSPAPANAADSASPTSTTASSTIVGGQEARPATPRVILRETFEFAASHRLHLSHRSDGENRALFGKCNNPNGHGHNYRIAVSVEVPAEKSADARPGFAELERIVESEIMARFDHKHLNLDCPEFAMTNPSVENIARISFEVLAEPFAAAGGRLRDVEVWETEKTSCRYPA
jgi:6-pyruvoyl-tetrahydropterin synthase